MQERYPTKVKIPRNQFSNDGALLGNDVQVVVRDATESPLPIRIGRITECNSDYIEVNITKKHRHIFTQFKKGFEQMGWKFESLHNHPYTSIFV